MGVQIESQKEGIIQDQNQKQNQSEFAGNMTPVIEAPATTAIVKDPLQATVEETPKVTAEATEDAVKDATKECPPAPATNPLVPAPVLTSVPEPAAVAAAIAAAASANSAAMAPPAQISMGPSPTNAAPPAGADQFIWRSNYKQVLRTEPERNADIALLNTFKRMKLNEGPWERHYRRNLFVSTYSSKDHEERQKFPIETGARAIDYLTNRLKKTKSKLHFCMGDDNRLEVIRGEIQSFKETVNSMEVHLACDKLIVIIEALINMDPEKSKMSYKIKF